jgi:asparagine synthase (glutamine-hydrolysing)
MGFGIPLAAWFRGELKDYSRQVLLERPAAARGYFRSAAVERMWNEHQSGAFDHAHRLWALLFFEQWHREWIDREPSRTAVGAPVPV